MLSVSYHVAKFRVNCASFRRFNATLAACGSTDGTKGGGVTAVNDTLSTMLARRDDYSTVYAYVLANVSVVDFDLVQVFLYNLMMSNNTSAVTTLLHVLFDTTPFKLSNEVWGCYVDNVCRNGNHLGAILIYHHLIDNHEFQAHKSCLVSENNVIPFLISPHMLQTLATIFHHNRDPGRCHGILHYFKRFYSYSKNKSVYKSLKISVVEAYASIEDVPNALKSFRSLASCFRGASAPDNWGLLNGVLKNSAIVNYKFRRNAIKQNLKLGLPYPSDIVSDLDAIQLQNPSVYDPVIEKNVYTTPETGHIPLLNGSLEIGDLPYFSKLITNHTKDLLRQSGIESIVPFIKSNHSIMHIFVVKALCELGLAKKAFLVLKTFPSSYSLVSPSKLVKDDGFIILLNYLKSNGGDIEIVHEIAKHYDLIHKHINLSSKIYGHILSALLASPQCSIDDLAVHLRKFNANSYIYLNEDDHEKFLTIIPDANAYPFVKSM